MRKVLLSLMTVIFAAPAGANQVTGPATAVHSTVIAINGQRIMLFGIDSVMRKLGLWQGGYMMPDAFRRAAGIFVDRP